ncbi:hypothetical protein [Sphingomonas sp. Root710]|uniref:hypothetical protein n=1 Tax=Sphingomonas sp. Root710 TaxID=1736594 RepID=UPI000AE9B689|nr:hypothetical protein [Sphingomonas sp. Root710]
MEQMTAFGHVEALDGASRFPLDAFGRPMGRPPVVGGAPVDITAGEMTGLWSLRFGTFGCPDGETRGGVVHIGEGLLGGGDSSFAYMGQWSMAGIELRARLDIARHSRDDTTTSIFGIGADVYHADCVAHAITPDLFEGRIRRPGYPDARLTMRRMAVRQSQATRTARDGWWRHFPNPGEHDTQSADARASQRQRGSQSESR